MHHVAQRWNPDDAVRIIGEQRPAGAGMHAGDGPIVAPLDWVRRKYDALVAADKIGQQPGLKSTQIQFGIGIQGNRRIQVHDFAGFARPKLNESLGMLK